MNTYKIYVSAHDYIEVEADRYDGGAEGELLRFYDGGQIVAKFKYWIAVIKDNG